ncbi:MAG: phosphoribosyltransferase [Chloroflexota bacterium]
MSTVHLPFPDRRTAGRLLAEALAHLRGRDGIVLALPRGGVVIGYEVARALGWPLDVFISRKLGAPWTPEYAIGAVAETGDVEINREALELARVSDEYLAAELRRQQEAIQEQRERYRGGKGLPPLEGKVVVLVDDGVATGLTVRAALRALRRMQPQRLVLAVPVGPPEAIAALRQEADEVICLATPKEFFAVGAHYLDFSQVSDAQVVALLEQAREFPKGRPAASPRTQEPKPDVHPAPSS